MLLLKSASNGLGCGAPGAPAGRSNPGSRPATPTSDIGFSAAADGDDEGELLLPAFCDMLSLPAAAMSEAGAAAAAALSALLLLLALSCLDLLLLPLVLVGGKAGVLLLLGAAAECRSSNVCICGPGRLLC
jgi:hypothetical protein